MFGKIKKIFNLKNKKETEEQKNNFIACIIHDVKNAIIANIRIFDLLLNKKFGVLSGEEIIVLEQLKSSSKYTLNMLVSVLDTYKYENGKIKYNFSSVNLSELTANLCNEWKNSLEDAENLKLIINQNNIIINADELQLRRVIDNLISNAIQYRHINTPIIISLTTTQQKVIFKVTNYGDAISKEYLQSLFEKYISNSQKFKNINFGLGLYLSKQIIQGHFGKMIAQSNPDGQNSFGFYLPLYYAKLNKTLKEEDNLIKN